jgi:hypothetical protein
MKKILFIVPIFLTMFCIQAQSDSLVASISTQLNNVLYIGIDNEVTIGTSNLCNQQANVSISCGSISYFENGKYKVRIKESCGSKTTISITYGTDGKTNTVKEEFRIKKVPDPIAKIGGKRGGKVDKTWLCAQTGIIASIEDFEYDIPYKVISFTLSFKDKNGWLNDIRLNADKFSAQIFEVIKTSNTGDEIYFDEIHAKGPDGILMDLGTISFTIK